MRRQEREEWESLGERDPSEDKEQLLVATTLHAMRFLGALLFSTLTLKKALGSRRNLLLCTWFQVNHKQPKRLAMLCKNLRVAQ